MRTAIDTNERALVGYYVESWKTGEDMQREALEQLQRLLRISEDHTLDLLNQYASDGQLIDRLGVETYDAEPWPDDPAPPAAAVVCDSPQLGYDLFPLAAAICTLALVTLTAWLAGW